jgi:ribA/ribD-fused uncharacterized protein
MEDYPQEVTARRKQLLPAFKAALRSPQLFTEPKLRVDKLIVGGKTYTVENMHRLPPELQPQNTAVIHTDHSVVFFTRNAIYSNLHPLNIKIDGKVFNCNEQFFQFSKAIFFNDLEAADRIMAERDPYKMMNIAKAIKGYNHTRWLQEARKYLTMANEAKYAQNANARQALLATKKKKIGEASANVIYGTGIGLLSKKASDVTAWTGQNMMGSILEEVRAKIMQSQ